MDSIILRPGPAAMRLLAPFVAAVLLATTGSALADIYRFDVNDPAATLGGQPFQNYFFFIDSSMSPTTYDAGTFSYEVIDFGSTFTPVAVLDMVTFYDFAELGGFANNLTTTFEQGAQVFNGMTSAPMFLDATFHYDTDQPNGGETLQVTDISAPLPISAAPEPGVWALLIAGVAMMGAALRFGRKRQVGASFSVA